MLKQEQETRSVSAIESGTCIDHIRRGYAFQLVDLLGLNTLNQRIFIGMHLPSESLGRKDLIKIEGYRISNQDAEKVAVFSPHATVNIIEDFEVVMKLAVSLPKEVLGHLACMNPTCITHFERMSTRFEVDTFKEEASLRCVYCEHTYLHEEFLRQEAWKK